jgi:hypothetical protein
VNAVTTITLQSPPSKGDMAPAAAGSILNVWGASKAAALMVNGGFVKCPCTHGNAGAVSLNEKREFCWRVGATGERPWVARILSLKRQRRESCRSTSRPCIPVLGGVRITDVECDHQSERSLIFLPARKRTRVRRQSIVKTCGNLNQSEAELGWAAKSSHLDAAMQPGGVAHQGGRHRGFSHEHCQTASLRRDRQINRSEH